MGADTNCACVKNKEELGELKTESEFLQTKSAAFSHRETNEEKEEDDLNDKLIAIIQHYLSNENRKDVTVSNVKQDEFENQISKYAIAKEILSKLSSDLSDNAYDKTGLFDLEPMSLKQSGESQCDYYSGSWNSKGQACGMGTLITRGGLIYKGMFNEGIFNGKGVMISPKGDYYLGEWKNGECEGKGQLTNSVGYYFKGEFKANKKTGQGIEHYPDGSMYEGGFENNDKHGRGKLLFHDGSSYEGNFNHNVFEGEGVYIWTDKRVYEGEFKCGAMNGNGKHKWEDGSVYFGNYVNNKKCGKGIYIWNDETELAGNWMNNEPHGKTVYLNNKARYEIIFRFGKIISSKVISNSYTNTRTIKPLTISLHFNKESQLNSNDIPKLPRLDLLQNKDKIGDLPDLVCQLCHDLLDQPYQCKKCCFNYCYDCIYNKKDNTFQKCLSNCKEDFGLNDEIITKMKELKLQ